MTAIPSPPASVTAAAVSSAVPGRWPVRPAAEDLAVTYTVQPACPSAIATPRPTPRLAPVTHATRLLAMGLTAFARQTTRSHRSGPIYVGSWQATDRQLDRGTPAEA